MILCFSQICFSQTDRNQKFQQIYAMLFAREYEKAKQQIDFELIASKNETEQILGYVALSYYLSLQHEKNTPYQQIKVAEKIEQLAEKGNNPCYKAYAEYAHVLLYKSLHKKKLFIESFNRTLNILNQYADENFLFCNLYFIKNGCTLAEIDQKKEYQDFIRNLKYAKKSKNPVNINTAINDLAKFHGYEYGTEVNKKSLDSVNFYLQQYYQNIAKVKYLPAQKMMFLTYETNHATTLVYEQKNGEAIKNLKKILEENKNNPDMIDMLFILYNNIGRIYQLNEDYEQALSYYLKAYALKDSKRIPTYGLIPLLNNISIIYKNSGKYKEALQFETEKAMLIKKGAEDDNEILEAFHQSEKRKSILEGKNRDLRGERYFYIGIVIFSTLIIILLALLIRYRRKINKQKNALLETEHIRMEAEQELTKKKYMIAELQLSHKNSVLTEIKGKTKEHDIDKLLKEEHLQDQNFNTIQNTIINIHPDFFNQLKILSKNKLTPLEIKYASFIYLHMDNHQISSYTKSDLNAVRVAKHRLKKKLGIGKEESIEDFIQNIKIKP